MWGKTFKVRNSIDNRKMNKMIIQRNINEAIKITKDKDQKFIKEYVDQHFPEGCKNRECDNCPLYKKMFRGELCDALNYNIPRSFKIVKILYAASMISLMVLMVLYKDYLNMLANMAGATFLYLLLLKNFKDKGYWSLRKGSKNRSFDN